jgi:hypothetical protein
MAYTEPPQWRRIGVNGALFAQSEGGNVGGSEGSVDCGIAVGAGKRSSIAFTTVRETEDDAGISSA